MLELEVFRLEMFGATDSMGGVSVSVVYMPNHSFHWCTKSTRSIRNSKTETEYRSMRCRHGTSKIPQDTDKIPNISKVTVSTSDKDYKLKGSAQESLTIVVDFQVVKDVMVGCPSGTSRKEHLAPFKVQLGIFVDHFGSIIRDFDGIGNNVHPQIVGLKIFDIWSLKKYEMISGICILCQGNVTGCGWVGMQLVGSIV